MIILDFPDEILIRIVVNTFEVEGLRAGLRLRLACARFNEITQDALFHLPLFILGRERISKEMTLKLIRAKLELQNAHRSPFCLTVNATVSYLTSDCSPDSPQRRRYVDALLEAATSSMYHWYLCKHLNAGHATIHGSLKDNALVASIVTNELQVAKNLLESGANVTAKTLFFGEPLSVAAASGSLEMIELLLKFQYWYVSDYFVQLRYIHAVEAAARCGRQEIVQALLDLRLFAPRCYSFESALLAAIRSGHDTIVKLLMPTYSEFDFSRTARDLWGAILRTAAECGCLHVMEHLVDIGMINTISKENFGHTLELACRNGHNAAVALLLKVIEAQEAKYYTNSLFWASYLGNHGVIDMLLATLIPNRQVIAKALSGAVSGKQFATVSYLLSTVGIDLSHRNPPPRTFSELIHILYPGLPPRRVDRRGPDDNAFQFFYPWQNPEGCLLDFLQHYCTLPSFHQGDHRRLGEHMFWAAVLNGQPDIILYLFENNFFSDRILDRAVQRGPRAVTDSSPAYQMALDYGFELRNSSQLMVGRQYEHLLHFLSSKADRDKTWPEAENYDAACNALFGAPMRMVRFILKTYPNITQSKLMSHAIYNSDSPLERIELLLDLGYPVDKSAILFHPLRNDDGGLIRRGTPLECAIERDDLEIVKYLLQRGANPTLVNARGRNALQFAQLKGNGHIIALLEQSIEDRMTGGLRKGRPPIWPSSVLGLSLLYLPRTSFRNAVFHRPDYLYGIRPREFFRIAPLGGI